MTSGVCLVSKTEGCFFGGVRGRLADLVGTRVQVGGTKLPEEPDDKVTKMNVTEVDPA
jgi:hypothetical protein